MRWSSGDYQIAPIAARSTAMGRWRLTPPGYGGGHCLRARDGKFRAPARVPFFCCQKKGTKEKHSNLRFKDPLARGGQVRIWRCVLAGGVQRSSLSVKRTVPAFTGAEASATACPSHGRGVFFCRVGDYQIAPIAARSTAMGRWRLTPPWYGDAACGRDGGRGTPHPSASGAPVSLRVGRFAGLTGHRPVIQYREPPRGKAFFARGRFFLALFIAFWRCRSARSETGATGRRRGLRRGQRSWGCPWCRWSWCRWWAGSSNSRRRREPSPTWP